MRTFLEAEGGREERRRRRKRVRIKKDRVQLLPSPQHTSRFLFLGKEREGC